MAWKDLLQPRVWLQPSRRQLEQCGLLLLAQRPNPIHQLELTLLEHRIHLTNNVRPNQSVEVLPAICEGTSHRNVSSEHQDMRQHSHR